MRYYNGSCLICVSDRQKIITMIENLKEAIDEIFDFRAEQQRDSYAPSLRNGRLFDENITDIRKMKTADADQSDDF